MADRPRQRRSVPRQQRQERGAGRLPARERAGGLRDGPPGRDHVHGARLERADPPQARLRVRAGDEGAASASVPRHESLTRAPSMRAVVCRAWGAVDDLRVEEVATPIPGPDEVLIAKAMGARVIAAASTPEKLAVARERGADELVNYTTEKLTERVMALTEGGGADVCFDPVGGDLFDAALSSLGWGGRILLVGFVGGVPNIPANRLLVKNRAALGSSLRYFRWHAPDKLRRSVDELLGWYEAGKLRPCISHRLPLEKSVEAIRLLPDRRAYGKVVVVPGLRAG